MNKTLMSSNEDNENDKTLMASKNNNENDKTLISSKDDDDERMNQNNNDIIKGLNDSLDKIIYKSKSFKYQINLIRKVENLNEYYFINDYGDKELKFKIFKLKLAYLSNIIDKEIFKQIFGQRFETLANKLISTTNKEEDPIIVNNISENKKKLYKEKETEPFCEFAIQPSNRRNNLIEVMNLLLDFKEKKSIRSDLKT